MTFPWEEVTTVANVIASLSVFSGIMVYKLEKTDAEIYGIQRAIIQLRTNVQSLDQNFRTELFSEMASATVYSDPLRPVYTKLLIELNKKIKKYQELPGKKTGRLRRASSGRTNSDGWCNSYFRIYTISAQNRGQN